jgi:hypothetical protein
MWCVYQRDMSSELTQLRGTGGQSTVAERKENAHRTVCTFLETYGATLQAENRHGTFKHDFVVKMGELHQYAAEGREKTIVHRKILDILGEQKRHMIQFQSCVNAFNRYLGALSLLDTMIQHGI